jgi:hypothetical protein
MAGEGLPALERLGLEPGASQSHLTFTRDLPTAVAGADLVQENGPERIDFKKKLHRQLDELLPADVIIASRLEASQIEALPHRQRRKESGDGRMRLRLASVRSRTARVMMALMRNGRDRRLGEPVMGHAILERVLLFGTRSADYIRASGHNGCNATEVTLQATTEAEYMTAPERFADSQIPLAPRVPSIHDPSAPSACGSAQSVLGICAGAQSCRREPKSWLA